MDLLFPVAIRNPESLSCIPRELVYANCGNLCWFFEFLMYITNLAIWLTGSPYYGRCLGYSIHCIIVSFVAIGIVLVIELLVDCFGMRPYITDSKAEMDTSLLLDEGT